MSSTSNTSKDTRKDTAKKTDQKQQGLDGEGGEGNREADRHYREATERYVAEGKVGPAAKEAERALDDEGQRRELERAEELGRSRAKEHDPESRR